MTTPGLTDRDPWTPYLRVPLILKAAGHGPKLHDDMLIHDAKELILAARALARLDSDRQAILRRVATLLIPYGLVPTVSYGRLMLSLDGRPFSIPL